MMVGCGLRNGEARAANVNNVVADDVYRVHERILSNTHRPAKLKHRRAGEFREVPLPRSVRREAVPCHGAARRRRGQQGGQPLGQREVAEVVGAEHQLVAVLGLSTRRVVEGDPALWTTASR